MFNSLDALENFLNEQKVDYSIYTDSRPIRSAQEGADLYNIPLSEATPTLILKANSKYYAAIICGNQRISFEKLKQTLALDSISLADPQTVLSLTGAKIGAVGLINEGISTLIDVHVLKNKSCYGGSGVPGKTLRISPKDLARVTQAKVLDFCL